MSKYAGIRDLLARSGRDRVTLGFEELGVAVPGGLPGSAFNHEAWWLDASEGTRHIQARHGWLAGGYRESVDLKGRSVTFVRIGHAEPRARPQTVTTGREAAKGDPPGPGSYLGEFADNIYGGQLLARRCRLLWPGDQQRSRFTDGQRSRQDSDHSAQPATIGQ